MTTTRIIGLRSHTESEVAINMEIANGLFINYNNVKGDGNLFCLTQRNKKSTTLYVRMGS